MTTEKTGREMFLSQVDADRLDELCRRFGVARLDVFGSVALGMADADSDVDLLYELAPGARLGWEIEDLAEELSALFGRRVDLVSRRSINARLRARIIDEAKPLYAA